MKALCWRSRRIGTRTCQSSISPSSPQSPLCGVIARQQTFDVPDHPLAVVTAPQLHVSSVRRLVYTSHSSSVSGNTRQDSLPIPFAAYHRWNTRQLCYSWKWLVEAFGVLIAMVNVMGEEHGKGCGLLL